MTTEQLYQLYLQHPSIQTDTRKLQSGDLYFALKGPNFNGNEFATQALELGASFAIVDEPQTEAHAHIIWVPDVLAALQDLARYHRQQLQIPVLAVTGSNGKTTTKELIHAVLSAHYRTSTTVGNLNNHIGVPLTLLRIPNNTEIAIIEMGANHQQEIAGYCTYTLPTHGLITNCGKAHLEGFGGEEGVRKGKGELFDFLREKQGHVFIMQDYAYLQPMSAGLTHRTTYGTQHADITGHVQASNPFLSVEIVQGFASNRKIDTKLVGDYNLPNVLAAVAVGCHFQVPEEKISSAIEAYVPSNSRSQWVTLGEQQIILDAYNANPSSMRAAIINFAQLEAPRKVLLLGGMKEMGDASQAEHEGIVALIQQYPWEAVGLVGPEFGMVAHPFQQFEQASQAGAWLKAFRGNVTVLLKGSRGSAMEKALD
jgi:UDP-N-acetylmuramoyl-tripeptide--D-alanyl-D-alanine ligase